MSNLIYKLQTATFIIGLAAGSDYFNNFIILGERLIQKVEWPNAYTGTKQRIDNMRRVSGMISFVVNRGGTR